MGREANLICYSGVSQLHTAFPHSHPTPCNLETVGVIVEMVGCLSVKNSKMLKEEDRSQRKTTMCGSAGAWWGRGRCYLEWRHLLAVHGAASDSVQVLPFWFPVSFLLREFLRQGEIPSHRSKQNKTFRGSASSDLQIGFSSSSSLLLRAFCLHTLAKPCTAQLKCSFVFLWFCAQLF